MPPSSAAFSDLYVLSPCSNARSSENTINCRSIVAKKLINSGKSAISSRWISTRLQSRPFFKMAPCTDFTSDDLPVPRAPHNSALFAGNRLAKAVVLVISKSRCSSTPRNKLSAKRLTAFTATNWRISECQTYASAVASDALSGAGGHWRSSALAIRVNCCKMALSVRFDIANALNKWFVSQKNWSGRRYGSLRQSARVVMFPVDFFMISGEKLTC